MMLHNDQIAVGKIVSTQGVRGEVKVLPLTDFLDRFQHTESVTVSHPSGRVQRMTVESARIHKEMVILKLAEIADMNAALRWVNAMLTVTRDELVPLPEGQYYVFDIIGLDVFNEEGELLGAVIDVLRPGANDVYVVRLTPEMRKRSSDHSEELLLPVIHDVIKEVDLAGRRMTVRVLDGLL